MAGVVETAAPTHAASLRTHALFAGPACFLSGVALNSSA